jgi:hypothetical protein
MPAGPTGRCRRIDQVGGSKGQGDLRGIEPHNGPWQRRSRGYQKEDRGEILGHELCPHPRPLSEGEGVLWFSSCLILMVSVYFAA